MPWLLATKLEPINMRRSTVSRRAMVVNLATKVCSLLLLCTRCLIVYRLVDLIDDPEVDAIYNPLPNGLHFEWTMKALKGGKHVLLEKPATDTADEASQIFALAKEKNLVVLEAFHYRCA